MLLIPLHSACNKHMQASDSTASTVASNLIRVHINVHEYDIGIKFSIMHNVQVCVCMSIVCIMHFKHIIINYNIIFLSF